MHAAQRRIGFTLVELLVVIAIIGVLVALLLPAVQAAREAARRMQCQNNLKQIGVAIHNHLDTKKSFPAGSNYGRTAERTPTWVVTLFPYFEQQGITARYDFNRFADQEPNLTLARSVSIPSLVCPSDPESSNPILKDRRQGAGSRNPIEAHGLWYTGSMGPTIPDTCDFSTSAPELRITCLGCAFGTITPASGTTPEQAREPCARFHTGGLTNTDTCIGIFCRRHVPTPLKSVSDGLSNTIMVGETLPKHWVWNCVFCDNFPVSSTHIPLNHMEGYDTPVSYWRTSGFKSEHPSGVNFLMADSSVHFISETIDRLTVNKLGSRAQEETLDEAPF